MYKFILLVALHAIGVFSRTAPSITDNNSCRIPVINPIHWKVFWPLAFRLNGSLYQTQDNNENGVSEILIPRNEEFYLSCSPNYIESYARTEFMKVKCSDGGKFLTTDKTLKTAKDLKCDLRTIEEVITPVNGCPVDAVSGQFGYIHPLDASVRIVGESCYNTVEGRTLFAHVRLGSNAEESLNPEVLTKEFFKKPTPSSTYKIDFMRSFRLDEFNERLQTILGIDDEIPGYQMANFIDPNYLLTNKQLMQTKKLVWNYFIIHDDIVNNLVALKKDISELGKTEQIDVFVGSHGITKLPNSKSVNVPIYLDNDKKRFPIPELIWLVVKKGTKAAAFGVFNNPSATNLGFTSPCKHSSCEKISWLKNVIADGNLIGKSDAIVCCEYEEFRGVVKELPRMTDITGFYN